MFKRPVYRGVIFAFRNPAQSHFISMSALDVLRLLFPVTMVIVASPACRLSHQSGHLAQPIGGILKNQKRKLLVPIALAVPPQQTRPHHLSAVIAHTDVPTQISHVLGGDVLAKNVTKHTTL